MTVTISINNNSKFCDDNGLTIIHPMDPTDEYDQEMIRMGITERREYPFELNVSNVNFGDLWRALGLVSEPCGEIGAAELEGRLNNVRKGLIKGLVLAPTDSGELENEEGTKVAWYCGGRTVEQVTRYYFELRKIVAAAKERGENISWG